MTMFRVTVTEINAMADLGAPHSEVERYSQTVDIVDLPKIIAAVNAKPRKPRERKVKAEK